MSPQDSAPEQADQTEAKPAEVAFAEKVLVREFTSVEEAEKTIKNLNSLVGDQTTAKQRKALEKLASQANLSPEELIEYTEAMGTEQPQEYKEETQQAPMQNIPDDTTKRLVRIETNEFIKEVPDASAIKDTLFAEALAINRPVEEIWKTKYAPVVEVGRKLGAKKLQTTLEGQPTKATSMASDSDDTKPDFSKMSSKEIESYLGHTPPSARL
jgi:uncharacterized protein (DUF849 family)